jgi:choline dehydrogenase-like flavoprotein
MGCATHDVTFHRGDLTLELLRRTRGGGKMRLQTGPGKKFPQPSFPHENMFIAPLDHDVKESVDVCVIGSGAGGAVMAKELAEAGHSVVIVEEGGHFTAEDFGQDVVTMTKLLYRNGGINNTFGWPAILVPVGKCVGGTTTINSGTCLRTPQHVFKRWVHEFGLSNWTHERVAPHFEKVEQTIGVEESDDAARKRNAEVFSVGLRNLGIRLR